MSDPAGPGTGQDATVVVRLWGWTVGGLLLAGGLLTAYFLSRGQGGSAGGWGYGGWGAGVLVATLITARFRYEVKAGRLTARERLDRTRSVDLTQLTRVIGPDQPVKPWSMPLLARRFLLELHDAQGSQVKLTLNATTTDQRRRLLAALEPYVMADGVARKGSFPQP
jgi:hypothetical protein